MMGIASIANEGVSDVRCLLEGQERVYFGEFTRCEVNGKKGGNGDGATVICFYKCGVDPGFDLGYFFGLGRVKDFGLLIWAGEI
nr:hypothetical protein [Tanacetum cinerariifolium]